MRVFVNFSSLTTPLWNTFQANKSTFNLHFFFFAHVICKAPVRKWGHPTWIWRQMPQRQHAYIKSDYSYHMLCLMLTNCYMKMTIYKIGEESQVNVFHSTFHLSRDFWHVRHCLTFTWWGPSDKYLPNWLRKPGKFLLLFFAFQLSQDLSMCAASQAQRFVMLFILTPRIQHSLPSLAPDWETKVPCLLGLNPDAMLLATWAPNSHSTKPWPPCRIPPPPIPNSSFARFRCIPLHFFTFILFNTPSSFYLFSSASCSSYC